MEKDVACNDGVLGSSIITEDNAALEGKQCTEEETTIGPSKLVAS